MLEILRMKATPTTYPGHDRAILEPIDHAGDTERGVVEFDNVLISDR